MSADDFELLQEARRGDRMALGRLLMHHDERLRRKIAAWIPRELTALLAVEDVLQETYADAYRHISKFEPQGEGAFYGWLVTIAERRFLNARRKFKAAKRGLARQIQSPTDYTASFVELVGVLADDASTVSHKAARSENKRLVQVALASLKEEYRQALKMRYIEGRPVNEIAAQMGRTDRAVHMLCNRGLHALREQMGSASLYLTRKG